MKPLLLKSLTFFALFICTSVLAQEKYTLYYDQNGKGLDTKKKAAYYRIVTFDENNKPLGVVEDFYPDDTLYRKGEATNIDKFDDIKSRWKDEVLTYNDESKLIASNNYDANGLLDSVQTIYNIDEERYSVLTYTHGNPTKDYYFVYDRKGDTSRYSYLTHLPVRLLLSTTDQVIVPITLRQLYYQDGQPVEFYSIDGIYVGVKISTQQLYGAYYEAYIEIENGSNPQFDFSPDNITATLEDGGNANEAEVMTYNDYMKRVKRRQNWTTAFTIFAESAAATSAGYSSSKTNTYIQTSTGKSVSVQSNTESYNGAAQYAAMQNAANNVNSMIRQQYDIRQTISEGYLKLNTIFPNSRLVGFVNIKFQKADHILLNVPVNGKVYHFEL